MTDNASPLVRLGTKKKAVAVPSAERSEKESSKMIVGFNKLQLSNNKNLKKHDQEIAVRFLV